MYENGNDDGKAEWTNGHKQRLQEEWKQQQQQKH